MGIHGGERSGLLSRRKLILSGFGKLCPNDGGGGGCEPHQAQGVPGRRSGVREHKRREENVPGMLWRHRQTLGEMK